MLTERLMLKSKSSIILGILLLIVAIFVGTYFGIYDKVPHFDKVLHLVGGAIVAWFFSDWFLWEYKLTRFQKIILMVAGAALVGTLWEFAERLSSIYSPGRFPLLYKYFYGGDLNDTLGDLAADLVGAFTFSVFKK